MEEGGRGKDDNIECEKEERKKGKKVNGKRNIQSKKRERDVPKDALRCDGWINR